MTTPDIEPPAPRFQRRTVTLSGHDLVDMRPLFEGTRLPLLVEPRLAGVDLITWARANRELLVEKLHQHGGVLFRGFQVTGPEHLESFIAAVADQALEYKERSSPRSSVQGNIYTSTDYPPQYPIFLHNENSYQSVWPLKIFFLCTIAPSVGGETPIADCRRVLDHIAPEVRRRFEEKGWMYVRNFGSGFGLDWPTVFQTEDRAQVEAYCRERGIEVEWRGDLLRTRAVRKAVARHPRTGEEVWFNHATMFHVSTLEPAVREGLLAELAEEDLPSNSYYGDGTAIEPEVLDHLRDAYRRETVAFPWQEGDLLMLDNMLAAHGRSAYSGPRKVLVGMADPITRAD